MEIEAADFYKNYSTDYHIFKQRLYADILYDIPHYEKKLIGRKLKESERQTLIFYLRLEIRQTLMHSIETLFELIFALMPSSSGELYDNDIMERLVNSKWRKNNQTIKDIAYKDSALEFLDIEIDAYGVKTSILRYLFYPNLKLEKENEKKMIQESIDVIKFGLRQIAHEFTNRADYNVIKHALRGIPFMKNLQFANAQTNEVILDYDLSESMTFYKKKENCEEEVEIVTKLFKTEYDLKLIDFTGGLIQNIMAIRESIYFRNSDKEPEKITVRFFGKKMIDDVIESKKGAIEFKISIPRRKQY